MASPITRIISDIHFGEAASSVSDIQSLAPLFSGVETVIINGDAMETRETTVEAKEHQETFFRFVSSTGVQATYITGNHDPDISNVHSVERNEGRVLITHGELLFDNLVPWGFDRAVIAQRYAEELQALTVEERDDLQRRLEVVKTVMKNLELKRHVAAGSGWQRFYHLALKVWPPWAPLLMIRAWYQVPNLAARFVAKYRPTAKFIILGHTHFPGVWQRNGVTVINTGSYIPPFGALVVDLQAQELVVRKVALRNGAYHPSSVVAKFALAATAALTNQA